MMEEINLDGGKPIDVQIALMKDQMEQDKEMVQRILESGAQPNNQMLYHNVATDGGIDILA